MLKKPENGLTMHVLYVDNPVDKSSHRVGFPHFPQKFAVLKNSPQISPHQNLLKSVENSKYPHDSCISVKYVIVDKKFIHNFVMTFTHSSS